MENQLELQWHEKPNNIIILLILFFPLGLYYMWKNKIWSKKTRWIITVTISILFIIGSNDKSSGTTNACNCLKELNSMNYTSSLYGKCIEIAVIAGSDDPVGYFQRKCNR
tara:strand:+ start:2238 stop:2567 length:330 start_codon:yes stop_codon:yes gene_type:complete